MEREFYISELEKRISEPRKFIQVVAGPRQVGKTTIINQFLERNPYEYIFDTADALDGNGQVWLEQIWNTSR